MDICLCSINLAEGILEYSGANRPLYIFRNAPSGNVFEEIKPSKFPVGGSQYSDDASNYRNHVIRFKKGDTFYLFSDGFCDQFGGEKDKKYMSKKFREQLHTIQPLGMVEQEISLRNSIEDWMGNLEQSDDILVIGLRPVPYN